MSDPTHILFLSMHYRPEPCDTRTSQLAKALARRGYRATALTSFPQYPFGRIYPGYRQKLVDKATDEGVELVRVPMFPDHSMSKKRRALSYFSFCLSACCIGTFAVKRPDLIWIHHPPLTTGIAGFLMAKVWRTPFVLEIHDLWPETLMSTGMIREGRVTRWIRRICAYLYRRADAIVVTSEGMKEHLAKQGVDSHKLYAFPQWADESTCVVEDRDLEFGKKFGLADKFNVLFAGNLGVAQGLDTLLDASKRLRHIDGLQVVLAGAGVELERLKKRAADEGLTNVRFLGHFSPKEMPQVYAWADACLLHLLHDPLFSITVPSKLQTYFAMGKPVLCGVSGDASAIVESSGAGITFPPEDAIGMADAIQTVHQMKPSDRSGLEDLAFKTYAEDFSQAALVDRYERLFGAILEAQGALHAAVQSREGTGAVELQEDAV